MISGRGWVITAIFALVVILDQLTKYMAEAYLKIGASISVIPGIFDFTLVYNRGAAFGMFAGLPDFYRKLVLWTVSSLGVVMVLWFLAREAKGDRWATAALAAVLGGAVGNMIDRIRYDAVVDFLDFYWNGSHWPAFNIADSAISIGVFVIIVRVLFGSAATAPRRQEAQHSFL